MPLKDISVAVILKEKPISVHTVAKDATVAEAVMEMNRQRIGSIMVMVGARPVGIFTERDVLTRVVAAGLNPKTTIVCDVMTVEFRSVVESTSIEDAMELMTEKRVRHLPVFTEGRMCGMLSIGDVTRWLLKANELEAETLRSYINADYPG